MREENFIAFWVVFGFFAGLTLAIWRYIEPFDILSVTLLATFVFYLIAHVGVALFIRFMAHGKIHFEKEAYDRKLDYFYNQLLQKESEIGTNEALLNEDIVNGLEKGG